MAKERQTWTDPFTGETYTSSGGNSTIEEEVEFKVMRGEKLTKDEWALFRKIQKERRGDPTGAYDTYDITPFD